MYGFKYRKKNKRHLILLPAADNTYKLLRNMLGGTAATVYKRLHSMGYIPKKRKLYESSIHEVLRSQFLCLFSIAYFDW